MGKAKITILRKQVSADTVSNRVYELCVEFSSMIGMDFDDSLVYLELRRLGPKTIGSLAKEINIDRNKIYRIVEKLESLGFVSFSFSNPKRCIAEEPNKVFSFLLKKKQNEIEKINNTKEDMIKQIENVSSNKIKKHLITFRVVEGLENIYLSISDLIEKSKNIVYIVMPVEDVLRMYHSDILEKIKICRQNGGTVYLLTNRIDKNTIPIINEINPTQIRLGKPPSKGRIIVSEDNELIMTESKESNSFLDEKQDVSLVTNSTEMTKNIFTLCRFLWDLAEPFELRHR